MSYHERVSTGEGLDKPQGTPPEESEQKDEPEEESSESSGQTESKTDNGDAEERRKQRLRYLASSVPLHQAALKGDWQEAKDVHAKYPDALPEPITERDDTALHIAAAAKRVSFVKELVKHLNKDDLARKNTNDETALHFAAASGVVIIAEEMVKKNEGLPSIRSNSNMTPLYIAVLLGHGEMVSYLFCKTWGDLCSKERFKLLVAAISKELYDTALKILKKDSSLATAMYEEKTALSELAIKPFAIGSKSQLSVWEQCYSWFKGIYNKANQQTLAHRLAEDLWSKVRLLEDQQFAKHVESFLFDAAERGNAELLIILIRSYPDLIWKIKANRGSIFHIAVLYRQEGVFNLIHEIGAIKDMILTYVDDKNQNILHLAGKLAPQSRLNMATGAALQMQRELLWFKELEAKVSPLYAHMKSKGKKGKIPRDLFTETHHDLKTRGETWMKDTANYCMLVATLITTVVFAAAFTVPGGYTTDIGTPVFLKSTWFMVFFISDAIALLSSSTSILMFLSILTSRYCEDDFLLALPRRLMIGLTALFMSIAGMVAAFSATCFLVYKSQMVWLPTVIIALAGVPISLFVLLNFKLGTDIILSIYSSEHLFRPRKNRLF